MTDNPYSQTEHYYPSLPGDWTTIYAKQLYEHPTRTSIGTIAAASLTAGLMALSPKIESFTIGKYAPLNQYHPLNWTKWSKWGPGLTSHLIGAVGLTKLCLTDIPDLTNSFRERKGLSTKLQNITSVVSDLAMVAGSAMRFIPSLKKLSWLATTTGALGRAASGIWWDYSSGNAFDLQKDVKPTKDLHENHVYIKDTSGDYYISRPYSLYLPEKYDKDKPLPIMFVMQGVTDGLNNRFMEVETSLSKYANQHTGFTPNGFAVVYLHPKLKDGEFADWNSPETGNGITPVDPSYSDIEYFKSVYKDVQCQFKADPERQVIVGLSSGGRFAQVLRNNMPHYFSGIATISSTSLGNEGNPNDSMPAIIVTQDKDNVLPIQGGFSLGSSIVNYFHNNRFKSLADSNPLTQVEMAIQANKCNSTPKVEHFKGVTLKEYDQGIFPVKHYHLEGYGLLGAILGCGNVDKHTIGTTQHSWPGAGFDKYMLLVATKTNGFNASQLVRDLFQYRLDQTWQDK